MHLPQGSLMLHLVCRLLQLGSRGYQLHHPKLLFLPPRMGCASGADNQGTVLGNATRNRINWPFQQLAVVTISPATTMLSLMVVLMPTTLISTKLKTCLLL